jgi:hypothetical protein
MNPHWGMRDSSYEAYLEKFEEVQTHMKESRNQSVVSYIKKIVQKVVPRLDVLTTYISSRRLLSPLL